MNILTLTQLITALQILGLFVIVSLPSLALKYIAGQEPFVKGRIFGFSRANAVLTALVIIAILHAIYGLGNII